MALIAQGRFTIHRKPDDGLTPVIYSLDVSDKLVSKSNAGVLTPSSVSARAVLQVGDKREVIGVDEKIDYKGRNYVLQGNLETREYILSSKFINLKGALYTISYEYEYRNLTTGNYYHTSRFGLEKGLEKSDGSMLWFGAFVNLPMGQTSISGVGRHTESMMITDDVISEFNSMTKYVQVVTGDYARIWNVKIERNNTATDWTPAPEDAQIKLFTGNGQTETAYTSGLNYAIKSADKLLKWQLLLNDQLQASESTTIVADGMEGPTGSQGIPGTSSYFHVKYSVNSNGNPMQDTPAKYIGTAATSSSTPPSSYTSYKWTQFQGSQGPKGDQGIAGTAGSDGRTPYLHIKYSDNGTSFTGNNGETPGDWIGQYTDFVQADSNSFSAYTWSKIRGDKGDPGAQGPAGISGALLRPRGEWEPNTQYANNTQYRDTVIYNKNKWIVKNTHTSGSSFDPAQWEDFNEFINVATQVLLADKAWIDILGAQGIAIGSDAANRWELTNGRIRHTATGLELTATGKIIAPPGGITFSSGKTVEDTIKDQVNAVQIGGRNYVLKSNAFITSNGVKGFDLNIASLNQLRGQSVTVSVFVKTINAIGRRVGFEPSIEYADGTSQYIGCWLNLNSTPVTTEGRIAETYMLQDKEIVRVGQKGIYIQDVTSDSVIVGQPQLELGTKPTDWKPAAEDIDAEINAAKASANEAKASVSSLNGYVDGAFKDGVVSAAEAKAIEKHLNELNLTMASVEATYNKLYANGYLEGSAKTNLLNAKINLFGARDNLRTAINSAIADGKTTTAEKENVDAKFTTFNSNMSSFQNAVEDANKAIQTKLDQLSSDKVDSIQIGGRNLLHNTDCKSWNGWEWHKSGGVTEQSVANGELFVDCVTGFSGWSFLENKTLVNWQAGKQYILSGDIYAANNGDVLVRVSNGGGGDIIHIEWINATGWTHFEIKFKVPDNWVKPQSNVIVSFYTASMQPSSVADSFHKFGLRKIKLELGNKPTDWTPAPEDTDYLTNAMQGDTVLNGGLVMSNVMAVRNGDDNTENSIVAGMSGLKDDGVFFFADVKNAYRKAINYFKGLSSDKPLFAVSKSGFVIAMTGLIGCFRIARDLVTIQDSTGKDKVKFTGESIEKFANSVPTMSGATLGNLLTDYNNTVGSFRQYTGTIETLSYSFSLSADTVFAITAKQNLKMEASATATEFPRVDAESYLTVNYRIEVKNNGVVVIDQLIQTEYIDAVTFDGPSRVNSYRDVALNYIQSQAFSKGTVEVKIYARYDMQLYSYSNPNNTVRSSAYAKIELKTGTANGLFTFVSTTDETIIGSDGLSIRLDSNNQFKLLKKDSILSMIFKGRVSPDSNIPDLICGGEVNQWGGYINKLGDDSSLYKGSVGHYRITLPSYMQGKSNYVVQITGINTDNIVTRGGVDAAANCFYVQTWQSPGVFEDAGFMYMVYRAK